jgi:acyl-CoA synthetase (AMP-forming)/AMP-acid ligase II
MLYDHIGGVNTMLYTLANTGCMVVVGERTPDRVLQAIERHRVDLLPTSPTFIHLLLLSEAYRRYDLSSLRLITYGTEPMPESTLRRLHALFPKIELRQTYGLSEVGILRSKSRDSGSLWVKVGGDSFQTRVVDGILQIKARSAMLGYLNAASPFTADGWLNTGDRVEVDGEYVRILGRDSEIVNVGGEKVYPIEVESVIQEFPNVGEVTVYGERNPITGNILVARIRLDEDGREPVEQKAFTSALKRHCQERLQSYKVPVKVIFSADPQHGARLKKTRKVLS